MFMLSCVLGTNQVLAQNNESSKKETLKVKVDFHCKNGKARIEEGLNKEKGVIKAIADLETKVVTIVYDSEKTNKEKLIAAIEKIGHKTEFTKDGTKIKSACSHEKHEHEEHEDK